MFAQSIIRRSAWLVVALVVVSGVVLAQGEKKETKEKKMTKADLPAAVIAAFEKAYPNATIKGVSKETEKKVTYFEVESVDGTMNRDLLYTADGKAAEIEETVNTADLPKEIQDALKKGAGKGTVAKAEKMTRGSVISYEFQIKTGKTTKELTIDAKGKVQKPAKGTKEKEDKEDEENEKD